MPARLQKYSRDFIRWLHEVNLFPFLMPVFFVLHIARYYHGAVPAISVLEMIFVYLLLTGSIHFVISRATNDKLGRGVATLMIIGLCLYWSEPIHFIISALGLNDNYNYYPFLVIAYSVLVFLICRGISRLNNRLSSGLFYYLNTLFVVFVSVELALIAFQSISGINEKPLIAMDTEELGSDRQAAPGNNIYLLLFDEYSSTSSLKENWGYNNGEIDSFLKARGFFINEKSRSNYCWTEFSMASLLNLDYFNRYRESLNYCDLPAKQECFKAIENARVPRILSNAGYELKTFSLFKIAGQRKHDVPGLMISKRKLITHHTLYSLLVEDYLPYIRHRSALKKNPGYRYPPFYKMDDYNNQAVAMVVNEAKQKRTKPKFVYAHFMMPHNPHFYDSADRLRPMHAVKSTLRKEEVVYYSYNVQHTNKRIKQMVDTILRYDPNAAITVLGDHGLRIEAENGRHPEYFRNMSAMYFPDRDYSSFPDSFSNVNVFRLVLNKVCGTRYPLLENKQYTLIEVN